MPTKIRSSIFILSATLLSVFLVAACSPLDSATQLQPTNPPSESSTAVAEPTDEVANTPLPEPTTAKTNAPVPEPANEPISMIDGLDRKVFLPVPAEKVVSLAPSNTEILFAVGAGDQVIGRDEFSDYPVVQV